MTSWLSDASANRHIKTYVKDFLDLSGNLTVRNAEGLTVEVPDVPTNGYAYLKLVGKRTDGTIDKREGYIGAGANSGNYGNDMIFKLKDSAVQDLTWDNAREIMRLTSNGNVGIGTTSPTTKLDVIDDGPVLFASSTSVHSSIKSAAGAKIILNNRTVSENSPSTDETKSHGKIIWAGHNRSLPSASIEGKSDGWDDAGELIFATSSGSGGAEERMRIADNGNIGIGTSAPRGRFAVAASSDTVHYRVSGYYYGWRWYSRYNRTWDFMHQADNDIFYVYFANNTSRGGYFDPNANVGQFTFTGQHRNFVENISSTECEDYKGLIVSANKNSYYDIDYSIKTGRDAIKINDALPYVSLCKKEKDKSCYGVISNGEDGEARKFSAGTFVSVKEKQYGDNRMFINSVGEGAIWVSNKNSNLESGDYITTSSIPGYGQKQDSEFLANYSVAKITMDCDFQPEYIYKKKVTTRNVDITGPDASGNYYDLLNNERLYTVDPEEIVVDNKNAKYDLTFDASNNLIGATQNVLNERGEIQWEDTAEQEYAYNIRHVDPSGNIITEEEYNTKIAASEEAYIAAFVGCTYHCG